MKKLLLMIFISISLFARLNPFEPSLNDKLKPIQAVQPVQSIDDGKRTVKIVSDEDAPKIKPVVMYKTKLIEKKLTKKELTSQCVNLKIDEMKEHDKKRAELIAMQKAKQKAKDEALLENFKSTTHNVLPFLSIQSNLDSLVIKANEEYTLIRYLFKEGPKKLVFDFRGKVRTSTKYMNFNAPHFKAYTIGNHRSENFFRVVISVKKDINKFKVKIIDDVATIKYIK